MKKHWIIYIIQLLSFIGTIYVNFLSTAQPINGYTPEQVSDIFSNKIVPAGFTFSIWGFIYLMLICYMVFYAYQLVKKSMPTILEFEKLSKWFILSNLINIAWIFSWHYLKPGICLILMIGLFSCLAMIFVINQSKIQLSLWPTLAFEGYFGWINVALVANTAAFLTAIKWNAFGMDTDIVAIIILLVLIGIGIFVSLKYHTIIYTLVLAWALYGVWSNIPNQTESEALIMIPLLGCCLFIIMALANLARDIFKPVI